MNGPSSARVASRRERGRATTCRCRARRTNDGRLVQAQGCLLSSGIAHTILCQMATMNPSGSPGDSRSVARVYANANERFGRSWWDYGESQAELHRC